jgi:geranylgeranyl reductase family protein
VAEPAPIDVLVAGAGPAGVAAALEAHGKGLSTLVVDKATFPRDKTCGDGLTAAALRRLDRLGLDVRGLPSWAVVRETVIVGPDGRELVLAHPRDRELAGIVTRFELDDALVELARDRGVDVRDGTALTGLRVEDDAVVAALGDAAVRARWIVAADGHYSPVRRMLAHHEGGPTRDSGPDLGTWHAFRQYFRGVADRRLWVLFEEDLLPGYAWVFPVGADRANVGFGVLRGRGHDRNGGALGKQLAKQWRDVVSRPRLRRILGGRAEPDGPVRAWPIPARWDERALTGASRVLYAGDAAGVVDPMTGEGIAEGGDTTAVAARYRADVRATLGSDLRFASALQRVLATAPGARLSLRAAGLTPWTRRNFARWMFEDYPRALVLTPSRWHRGAESFADANPGSRRGGRTLH